jgi:hypothetical protein
VLATCNAVGCKFSRLVVEIDEFARRQWQQVGAKRLHGIEQRIVSPVVRDFVSERGFSFEG